jgi:hypothetical protein
LGHGRELQQSVSGHLGKDGAGTGQASQGSGAENKSEMACTHNKRNRLQMQREME